LPEQEFLPLAKILAAIQRSVAEAGSAVESNFVLGESTVSIPFEVRTDGDRTLVRPPSFQPDGQNVPPEYVARISVTFRPTVVFEERPK